MADPIRSENIENQYGLEHHEVFRSTAAATSGNYGVFFNVLNPIELVIVAVSFESASSSGALQIEKLTSGQAPGAGETILLSAFGLAGTANVVTYKNQRDMTRARTFVRGDRIAFLASGTLTGLTDLTVSIYYKPLGRGDYR